MSTYHAAPGPRLVGVLHLPPLPGSPRSSESAAVIAAGVAQEATMLAEAGYDAAIVENFGDAPFFKGAVPSVTVAAITACAFAAKTAAPGLPLGINVLRNDAAAAMAIAAVVGAICIRVNVHSGARVTDQGIVEGSAAETLRLRRNLGAHDVGIWADVDVKHAAPLARRPIEEEAEELAGRALADALLVTGTGTGVAIALEDLKRVHAAARGAPLYVASGADPSQLGALAEHAHGVIVGSYLRADGRAGAPLDAGRVLAFAKAFRKAFA